MNNPKKSLSVLFGTALALSLSGCIPLDQPTLGGPTVSSEQVEAPASEEPDESVGTFGQVVHWDDVDIVVSKPKAYKVSDTGAGGETFEHSVSMVVKVTNTGNEPFDPSMMYMTASSAEQEAAEIFDTENNIGGAPMTPVLPGKSVKWSVAWNVADPADVLVQVTPDMMANDAVLFSTGE